MQIRLFIYPLTCRRAVVPATCRLRARLFRDVLWLAAGFLFAVQAVLAQPLQVQRFTEADGLPSNSILSLLQDRQGYVWIGTTAGLSRYDGHSFRTFFHNPADSTTIGNDAAESLYEDREGYIWVGGFEGTLSRYDPKTESFTVFRHDASDPRGLGEAHIRAIMEDEEGTLWVGSSGAGLCRFDRTSGTCSRFMHDPADPNSLSDNEVRSILEDRHGTLWVGTGDFTAETPDRGGLNRLDRATGRFTRYRHDPTDRTSLSDNLIEELLEDREGNLWVGTGGDGLHRYERETDTFTRVDIGPGSSIRPVFSSAWGSAPPRGITIIAEERADRHALWVGTLFGSLLRIDRATGKVTRYDADPADARSLSSSVLWTFLEDRQGSIWIGTLGGGLNKISPTTVKFRPTQVKEGEPGLGRRSITAAYEEENGTRWIGTLEGLSRHDSETGHETLFRHDPSNPFTLSHSHINSVKEDSDGVLWVGTWDGLNRLDRSTGRFHLIRPERTDNAGPANFWVTALQEDDEGRLWVGSTRGLHRLDRVAGDLVPIRNETGPRAAIPLRDLITALYRDRAGAIWVGTNDGVFQLDPETGALALKLDTGASASVATLLEDRSGKLWVGVSDRWTGLYQLDPETGSSVRYTAVDGLPSSSIRSILEDETGRLWVGTGNGLSHFDPQTGLFRNFGVEDGLPSGDFSWSAFRSKRGQMVFGTSEGLVTFFPNEIRDNEIPPQVLLTDLSVFGESVVSGPNRVVQTALSFATEVKLAHNRNDLTFSYAGLHFADPERNRYRYRLEPYEDQWVEAGTERSARYTNLSPGEYFFRVTAANSDGVWNPDGATLRVLILPPWWRTLWAYIGYGLLLAGGIFGVDRVQRRRLVQRERERARDRELEQAREIEQAYNELEEAHGQLKTTQRRLIQSEKLASLGQLTAGIAHEIQNPLNFVNNFAEVNRELVRDLDSDIASGSLHGPDEIRAELGHLEKNSEQIVKHGKRAEAIVRSMMEHAAVGGGERFEVGLNAFLEEYAEIAYNGLRARMPGLDVQIERDFDSSVGNVRLSPKELGRALTNILNNAFEAAHERSLSGDAGFQPRVRVGSRQVEGGVEIRIEDNGTGIPPSVREKIFEPFFTTKPAGTGTGLGLSLAYEIIVDGHAGSLSVENEEGEGARFVVGLPVQN